jgi:hypothetical protein
MAARAKVLSTGAAASGCFMVGESVAYKYADAEHKLEVAATVPGTLATCGAAAVTALQRNLTCGAVQARCMYCTHLGQCTAKCP